MTMAKKSRFFPLPNQWKKAIKFHSHLYLQYTRCSRQYRQTPVW